MCDIVRTVKGVFGERMLGGGDKGASGAIVAAEAVEAVEKAVETGYPAAWPEYAKKSDSSPGYAVHTVSICDGVALLDMNGKKLS